MNRLPERQTSERRRPSRSRKPLHSSFPPGVRQVVVSPSVYARIPIPTSILAPSPRLRSADTTRTPGIWHPGSPDVPNYQRPRSPSLPPFSHARISTVDQPDVPLPRAESPSTAIDRSHHENEAREILIGAPTVTLLKEVVKLREKDLSKRSTLKNGVQDIVYQWQYAEETQENFMRACDALMATLPSLDLDIALRQKLQETWTQLQDMSQHVTAREHTLSSSLHQLFELENRLAIKEKRVYQKFDALFGHGAVNSEDEEEYIMTDNLGGMITPSRASSATTCSMAHEYYNKVGEIQLLKEDLFNFDSEHRKQEYIRETQRQSGHQVEPSDDVFYHKFMDGKAAMVRKYMAIVEKMENTREKCHMEGVEVDEPNLPGFLDHTLREELSLHDRSENGQDGNLDPATFQRDEAADNLLLIERWTDNTQVNRPIHFQNHETWDSLSGQRAPHTMNWAEQQAEIASACPQFGNLEPTTAVPDDEEILKARGRPPQSRTAAVSQGERPSRRYSTPALPTFSSRVLLRNGVLASVPRHPLAGYPEQPHWQGVGILATYR